MPSKNEYFDNKLILDFEQRLNIHHMKEYSKGKGVKVAIIDTGLAGDSPFKDDVIFGMNMYDRTKSYDDDLGHGTAVASIIKRIAPESQLLIFKCLNDKGTGAIMNIMDGITGAIAWKADIIITSLCMDNMRVPVGLDEKFSQAIKKGIVLIAPSGNLNDPIVQFPACKDGVWGIAGLDASKDERSYFSNFGDGIDFIAPSVDIETLGLNNESVLKTGTSYSAPIIGGMLALSKSYVIDNNNVDKNNKEWYNVFKDSCIKKVNKTDGGNGIPDGEEIINILKHD